VASSGVARRLAFMESAPAVERPSLLALSRPRVPRVGREISA
jgi:hypothetical protein